MYRERLERLIDVLTRVEQSRLPFDMTTWAGYELCNTTACALGWAAFDPGFQADGLTLINAWKNEPVFLSMEEYHTAVKADRRILPMVKYENVYNYDACQRLFEISASVASYLFDPDTYPNGGSETAPAAVIARVQEVIASKWATRR